MDQRGFGRLKTPCFWTSRCVWSWPQPGIFPRFIIWRLHFSERAVSGWWSALFKLGLSVCYQTAIVVRRKKYIMFCFNLNYLIKKFPPPFFPECWLCLQVPLRCLFKLPPYTYQWADRLLFPGVTQSESWSLTLRNEATLFLCLLNPDWSLFFVLPLNNLPECQGHGFE